MTRTSVAQLARLWTLTSQAEAEPTVSLLEEQSLPPGSTSCGTPDRGRRRRFSLDTPDAAQPRRVRRVQVNPANVASAAEERESSDDEPARGVAEERPPEDATEDAPDHEAFAVTVGQKELQADDGRGEAEYDRNRPQSRDDAPPAPAGQANRNLDDDFFRQREVGVTQQHREEEQRNGAAEHPSRGYVPECCGLAGCAGLAAADNACVVGNRPSRRHNEGVAHPVGRPAVEARPRQSPRPRPDPDCLPASRTRDAALFGSGIGLDHPVTMRTLAETHFRIIAGILRHR